MDHLAIAKSAIALSDDQTEGNPDLPPLYALQAIAHALIAIAECARLAIEDGKKSE